MLHNLVLELNYVGSSDARADFAAGHQPLRPGDDRPYFEPYRRQQLLRGRGRAIATSGAASKRLLQLRHSARIQECQPVQLQQPASQPHPADRRLALHRAHLLRSGLYLVPRHRQCFRVPREKQRRPDLQPRLVPRIQRPGRSQPHHVQRWLGHAMGQSLGVWAQALDARLELVPRSSPGIPVSPTMCLRAWATDSILEPRVPPAQAILTTFMPILLGRLNTLNPRQLQDSRSQRR